MPKSDSISCSALYLLILLLELVLLTLPRTTESLSINGTFSIGYVDDETDVRSVGGDPAGRKAEILRAPAITMAIERFKKEGGLVDFNFE